MIGFKKFDPRAFLEQQKITSVCRGEFRRPDALGKSKTGTLASLAALADREPENAVDCLKPLPLIGRCNQQRNDGSGAQAPAKVAKAAQVSSSKYNLPSGLWGDHEAERAAIIEYDGGAPREWAEALARLDPAAPPGDVPPKRWVQFIDGCGHFIDNGWDQRAAELGWTPFDLFGCDRYKPFARVGRCGLLWLLDGRHLRILTTDTAVINTPKGSSLTFYRRPREPGQVLPWEIAP
jgi:hypothetical protein